MRPALIPILAVLAGVALPAVPASAQDYVVIATNLFGNAVVGEGAGETAGGDFDGEIDFGQNRICYYLDVFGLEGASAAHIHEGAAGETGPAVITLALPSETSDEVCTQADAALFRAIAANPAGYYADIHTAAHPDGALRGQFHD